MPSSESFAYSQPFEVGGPGIRSILWSECFVKLGMWVPAMIPHGGALPTGDRRFLLTYGCFFRASLDHHVDHACAYLRHRSDSNLSPPRGITMFPAVSLNDVLALVLLLTVTVCSGLQVSF